MELDDETGEQQPHEEDDDAEEADGDESEDMPIEPNFSPVSAAARTQLADDDEEESNGSDAAELAEALHGLEASDAMAAESTAPKRAKKRARSDDAPPRSSSSNSGAESEPAAAAKKSKPSTGPGSPQTPRAESVNQSTTDAAAAASANASTTTGTGSGGSGSKNVHFNMSRNEVQIFVKRSQLTPKRSPLALSVPRGAAPKTILKKTNSPIVATNVARDKGDTARKSDKASSKKGNTAQRQGAGGASGNDNDSKRVPKKLNFDTVDADASLNIVGAAAPISPKRPRAEEFF
jgi:hypothetical protein